MGLNASRMSRVTNAVKSLIILSILLFLAYALVPEMEITVRFHMSRLILLLLGLSVFALVSAFIINLYTVHSMRP